MAPSAPPTIPSWKTSFLTTQISALSRPVAPSRAWRGANDTDNQPISEPLLDEALNDINLALRKHCRRVYPPQATRNVAEQINSLYVSHAERVLAGDGDDMEARELGREVDLSACATENLVD